MDEALINYILAHENADLAKLLLKKKILDHPASFVANQINGRRRAKDKLPTWYANPAIVYPPQQNLEQCSSETTAMFKCEIVKRSAKTETIADLTGGFGVDSFFFSREFLKVYHIEPDAGLCALAKENHALLKSVGTHNPIEYVESTAEEFIPKITQKLSWIFLDPSRKANGKKILKLTDSQPDATKLLPLLFLKTDNILIKTSPLLDLKDGLKQLPGTREIFVVSVGNECKEVLFRLEKGWTSEPEIICIHINSNGEESFPFRFSEETKIEINFREPQEFIYEPNTSLLKAGAFKSIAQAYGLSKIAVNTHLYTSNKRIAEFPGRVFRVQSPFSTLEKGRGLMYNIVCRNHPLTPEQIKKKFKLKDGGEKYLLAFSGISKKYLMAAERLK